MGTWRHEFSVYVKADGPFEIKTTVLRYKKHFYLTQSLTEIKKSPLKIVLAKTGSLTTLNKRITI